MSEPTKNAGPGATGPSVKNETSAQVYPGRNRRTPRTVRMRDTSREAFARTAPTRMRARAEVLRVITEADAAGLTDPEIFRLLPAWGESTLRPARNRLVADRLVVATAARRYSPSGYACIVWRLSAFADASTTATNPCGPPDGPGHGQQPPHQPARLDSARAHTPDPAPQADGQAKEPDGVGGAS